MRDIMNLACGLVIGCGLAASSSATDLYNGTNSQVVSSGAEPLNIFGGTFNGGIQANGGRINIFGGSFQSEVQSNGGNIQISGGEFFSYITANGSDARISVTDGIFHAQLGVNGGSLFVSGGEFASLPITYAFIGASVGSVTLYGSDFAINGSPIPNGLFRQYGGGQLTGTFANGHPINVPLVNNQGEFHFVPVPEPHMLLPLLCGTFSFLLTNRRLTPR